MTDTNPTRAARFADYLLEENLTLLGCLAILAFFAIAAAVMALAMLAES